MKTLKIKIIRFKISRDILMTRISGLYKIACPCSTSVVLHLLQACCELDNSHLKTSRPRNRAKNHIPIERPVTLREYIPRSSKHADDAVADGRDYFINRDGHDAMDRQPLRDARCMSSARAICSRVSDNELSLRLLDKRRRTASRRTIHVIAHVHVPSHAAYRADMLLHPICMGEVVQPRLENV